MRNKIHGYVKGFAYESIHPSSIALKAAGRSSLSWGRGAHLDPDPVDHGVRQARTPVAVDTAISPEK